MQDLFVLFQRCAASGAVGDNGVNVHFQEQVEVVGRQAAGGLPVAFGQMRRAAALLLFRGDDVKALVAEDPHGLAGDFGVHQGHDTAEKEADFATFLPFCQSDFRDALA